MRVRNFREEDIPALFVVQREAREQDGLAVVTEEEQRAWLLDPQVAASENIFVLTDDDDELQTWGQAGTLEGIEGPIIGYTWVHVWHDAEGYHLRCEGAVLPAERGRSAGRALLVSALNRARFLATDFEFEAELEGEPIYFEVLLPAREQVTSQLATAYELQRVEGAVSESQGNACRWNLYRRLL